MSGERARIVGMVVTLWASSHHPVSRKRFAGIKRGKYKSAKQIQEKLTDKEETCNDY